MDGYITKPIDPVKAVTYIESLAHKPQIAEPGGEYLGSNIVFDKNSFMDRCLNDTGLAAEIIKCFLGNYPDYLYDIREAIKSDDQKKLHHFAHSLKGGLFNLSALRAGNLALELELMGKNSQLINSKEVFSQLVEEVELLAGELKEVIA
ncbi:MAG: Hpt domain-containing protein [Deltaproteobacteria bacterium]|nr:Hpt domain-containing protein [Deltaproteobacteria bacterium]